jgi:putative heme-binding domain-containing protein
LAGQGNELGPDLDGIGSHPAAELLVHIVDPNRMVDDEHRTWNLTLKDGTQHSALIASENAAMVRLRMAAGVTLDVPAGDIVRRDKSANSLMPEGLEALGGEALRDVIAYIQGFAPGAAGPVTMTGTAEGGVVVPAGGIRGELRPLNLAGLCTADTRWGLYASSNAVSDTLPFVKFGRVTANGVPFEVLDPARSAGGRNVIVLRGGPPDSFARTLPQRVEIPVGFAASRLHFLGGVAGWGGGPGGNTPVMKVTLHYAGGGTQVAELRAGREFVDYIRRVDVPGSAYAAGVVRDKQVRTFAVPVRQAAVIEKVVLESAGARPAPTTVAITAELRAP